MVGRSLALALGNIMQTNFQWVIPTNRVFVKSPKSLPTYDEGTESITHCLTSTVKYGVPYKKCYVTLMVGKG